MLLQFLIVVRILQDVSAIAALPIDLLSSILHLACKQEEGLPAAASVRNLVQLSLTSRRFKALLRAQPPPLTLNFPEGAFTGAQRAWLLSPRRLGAVHAASFSPISLLGDVSLVQWVKEFVTLEARTLRHLWGLPIYFLTSSSRSAPLDLSQSAITVLGLGLFRANNGFLAAARLPAGLKRLELLALCEGAEIPTWSRRPADNPLCCLAGLHTVACTMPQGRGDWLGDLLELGRQGACLSVDVCGSSTLGLQVEAGKSVHGRALHVRTPSLCVWGSTRAVLHSLFADGLREVSLVFVCQEAVFRRQPDFRQHTTRKRVFLEHASRAYGHEFAFEASDSLLAWRRWPPAGTPAWQAAAARHEAARQWAAEGDGGLGYPYPT